MLPLVSDMYEESTTSDITGVIARKSMDEDMYRVFTASPWFGKYSEDGKRVDKKDLPSVYFYFRDEMMKKNNYNLVEVLCAICEFFGLNYSYMYNNVLSLADKSKVLEILEDDYGLSERFGKTNRLF